MAEGVSPGATRHTHYDMAGAFRSVTKWVGEVDRPELVPDYARRAFTHLRSGRPGPVLLIVPRDLGEYDEGEHPYAPVKGWRSGPDPDDVKAAVRALLGARDPLLHVGEGVLYADATAELTQFAELAQVPVLTTLKAKGAFPERHPLSVGVRGSLAEHFLRKADLLFSVGSSLFPNRFSHAVPDAEGKTIVQCTVDTLDINRSYETRHAVIGDARLTLQALIDELSARGGVRPKPALVEEIRARKQAFLGDVPAVDGVERDPDQPLSRDRRPDEGPRPRRARSSPPTPAILGIRPAPSTRRRSPAGSSAGATCPPWGSAWPAPSRPSSRTRTGSASTSRAMPGSAT